MESGSAEIADADPRASGADGKCAWLVVGGVTEQAGEEDGAGGAEWVGGEQDAERRHAAGKTGGKRA
ncbi:unnamed protein product [Boreogadus saida]